MAKFHARLASLALLTALTAPAAAHADDTPSDVASDVSAVQKDNTATAKDNADLAKHRAMKAQDKANNNWAGQADDSIAIGVDKMKHGAKNTEKASDKKTLNNDVDDDTQEQQEQ